MTHRSPKNRASTQRQLFGRVGRLFALCGLLLSLAGPVSALEQAKMDDDILLKPLVDTSQPDQQTSEQSADTTLHGSAEKKGTVPVNASPGPTTKMLIGKVQTLQQAIESEKDTVNWYAWYLAAREYLGRTGGLPCALGTPIKFYRNGVIEPMTFDPQCVASVSRRRFSLPKDTQLDAIILPVRPGEGPPASPQEIYSRINSLKPR